MGLEDVDRVFCEQGEACVYEGWEVRRLLIIPCFYRALILVVAVTL